MSRLEEVKHLVGYVNKAVEDDDGNNVITTLIELTSEGHIDWLIKQAELSREWQLVATDRFNDWYKADQLNNRYKQAIENSLDGLKSGGAGTRSIVKGYLEKALEESE